MTEPERFERHLDDFGERLSAAAARAPRPRHRPHPRLLAIAGAVLAAVVVAVVVTGSDGRSLDAVAEARAALAPAGEIVYMKITTSAIAPGASSVPPPQTTEQWSALDPPRWRFVQTIAPSRSATIADARGAITGRQELSYGDGVARTYHADRDTLVVTRGHRDGEGASRLPSVLGQGSGDPAADLRSMLLKGTVTDRGEQQLRGRAVRRFVIEQRSHRPNDPAILRRMVYAVDPETFAPVEGRFSITFGTGRPLPRMTSVMRVDAYKRIPLDATSAKLLQITTTPRTKATFDTAAKLRARIRAWRAKCRPIQKGRALACPPPEGVAKPR